MIPAKAAAATASALAASIFSVVACMVLPPCRLSTRLPDRRGTGKERDRRAHGGVPPLARRQSVTVALLVRQG